MHLYYISMLDPYRMVVINVVVSLIAISAFFIYKYLKPKKTPPYPLIIFILSLLPLISLLRRGTYESGDLFIHVVRLISFYSSLNEGIMIPTWAGELNSGYGYPIFNFDAPLQYYASSILHFFGFGFIGSIKTLIGLSFVLSGFSIYFWLKNWIGARGAFVSSIFYLFAPYHLVNMHFRVSVGELILFSIFPLILLSTDKLFHTKKAKWFLLNSIIVQLAILSSPTALVVFTFIPFYIGVILYKKNKMRNLILVCISYLLGIFGAAFYWLPVLLEGKFTHQINLHALVTFQSFQNIIFKSHLYGLLYQGENGELSFIIGFAQLLLIFLGIILILKKKRKKEKKLFMFFLMCLIITSFLITSYSRFVWEIIPLYNNLQFSYRLLILVSLLSAALAGITSIKIGPKLLFVICLFAIFSTILNWGNRKVIVEKNDAYFINKLSSITAEGEGGIPAAPIWTDPKNIWQKKKADNNLEIISGLGLVKELSRTSINHSYLVKIKNKSVLRENTYYFPGWILTVNDKTHRFIYKNTNPKGTISFELNPGTYEVNLNFTDTKAKKISKILSLISLISLILLSIVLKRRVKI